MKKRLRYSVIICLFLASCYYDNEEDLYPDTEISGDVTYSVQIEPIIRTKCAISGCHTPTGTGPGNFQNVDEVIAVGQNGKLKDRVIDRMDMPSSQPLPLNERNLIQAWIDQGLAR